MTKLIQQYALLVILLMLAACADPTYHVRVLDTPTSTPSPTGKVKPTQRAYEVNGQRYQPIPSAKGFVEKGIASWYGKKFHGRKTSNGETYDMYAMTAAHKTLPMNVHLKVTNLDNGRSTVVRVNDRGPFVRSRIIDLSYSAANELGVVGPGTANVRIEALGYQDKGSTGSTPRYTQLDSYDVGPFMIQVGAFTIKENADRLAVKLKGLYGSSSVATGWVNGQKFYRVRVGLYNAMADASRGLLEVEANGYPSSFIVAQ
jgi:rare lipoprotein A